MSPELLFLDLAPEVISSILACCDISSVIAIAQTCQYLHCLAFHKSVWQSLLENLRGRSIIDLNYIPDVESLSTEDIIGVVRRLLTGPDAWNNPHPSHELVPATREITLHPESALTDPQSVKLLPSGRYVLLLNLNQLWCWNVAENRLIWTYSAAEEHTRLLAFAAEEPGGGGSLVIMICARTFLPAGVSENYVDIVRVNLETETHYSLLIARCPDSLTDYPFQQFDIRGDFAVISIYNAPPRHMVINWQKHSHFVIKDIDGQIVLLQRHIMVKTSSLDGEDEIHIVSNDALHSFLDSDCRTLVNTDFIKQSFSSVHVFDSPLQEGNYRVWIYTTPRTLDRSGLISYHLSIPVDGQPTWRGPTLWSEAEHVPRRFPYSGHAPVRMTGWFNGYTFLVPGPRGEGTRTRLILLRNLGPIDVGAYSASVTYITPSSIVIRYYE
ncbi:hypothetical protein MSAN_01815300 [Mycena sanguinolenta]|uniref:F-box domain-containing protein n=1 Tax=Mycena sanguinolenta TaxID=230812 RepID=A0A8H7CTE0_9AGAR|nr:hypothetical protein MSAN_01815300 [Mycena sanguinolenta]